MPQQSLPLRERERLLMTEYERWPQLAREWIDAGYDSPTLRDFAALSPAEGASLADLMTDVLASLGVSVRAGVPVTDQLSSLTDLETRCRRVLDVVAGDVARTWGDLDLGLLVYVVEHVPAVNVTVTIAGRSQPDSDTMMSLSMPDVELLLVAAHGVRETLLVHFGVEWPVCAAHDVTARAEPSGDGDRDKGGRPVWWCPAGRGHVIEAIGALPAAAVLPPDRPASGLTPPSWW